MSDTPERAPLREILKGADLQRTEEALAQIEAIKKATPLAGSLDKPALVSELFGCTAELPVNWMTLPDRCLEYIHFRVQPGHGFPTHMHAYGEEVYLITGGRGVVMMDGQEYPCKTGDVFHLRREMRHTIWNPAENTEDLTLFLVNAPTISYSLRKAFWPVVSPQENGK